jgi:hypothetical protein
MTAIMLALAMLLQQNIAQVPKVSGPIEGPGVMYPGLRELQSSERHDQRPADCFVLLLHSVFRNSEQANRCVREVPELTPL